MVIGIDGNEANVKEGVGVNQYALEIIRKFYQLSKSSKQGDKFIIYLKDKPSADFPKENVNFKYKVLPGKRMWVVTRLTPYLVQHKEIDVFFSPNHYLPFFLPYPKVCTIHDLGYLKFTEQFKKNDFWQLKYWSAISIIISKYIISVSNSTRKDIVRHYRFASKKVKVVYNGYDNKRFNMNISPNLVRQVMEKYKIKGEYLLFLSTLKPNKNIEGLLDAYYQLPIKLKRYKLVIAGKKGWLYKNIFEKVDKLGLKNRIIFTDYIQEKDKPALIKGAKIFVLPSFWEGFGLDVLEAMACGVPVVISNVASLPEIAGEAGIYVNPLNIESIRKGLIKGLTMKSKEYNMIIKKGLKRARKFSWDNCAKETLSIIKKASQ